jgi:hypothetical protein
MIKDCVIKADKAAQLHDSLQKNGVIRKKAENTIPVFLHNDNFTNVEAFPKQLTLVFHNLPVLELSDAGNRRLDSGGMTPLGGQHQAHVIKMELAQRRLSKP